MISKLTISQRIAAGFGAVLVLMVLVLQFINLSNMHAISEHSEQQKLNELVKSFRQMLGTEADLAEAQATQIASNKLFSAKFAAGDRQGLAEILVPVFKQLKQRYAFKQFQYHTPESHSFLRLHKPAKFGDDLSGFRKTVVAANAGRKHVKGLEKGVAGIGIRGIAPVSHEGKHVGTVEFGLALSQRLLDQYKKRFNVDAVLYIKSGDGFKVAMSTRKDTAALKPQEVSEILSGKVRIEKTEIGDSPVAITADALKDFSGNKIAIIKIVMDRSKFVSDIASARNQAIITGIIAILIGIVVAVLIGRGIVGPIKRATHALEDIAEGEGDLTQRLEVRGKDEIAALSTSFNKFIDTIHDMIRHISGSTVQLGSASEEMAAITESSNQGIQRQRMETEQVATAMNEMTSTVQEVARNAAEAASAAQNANNEADHGHQVVNSTVTAINSLANEIDTAAAVIMKLEEDSQNIESVLDVIRGIAEQTNLLALNAAIEAARAGEQGRGFAVVADEVRTLASRTQQSTQEINDIIEHLQNDAHAAVQAIESSKKQADSGVEHAREAGESLDTITSSIASINDMNIQIASAADEQSAVADEINNNIISINNIAEESVSASSQTSTASSEMASLASDLQNLVGRFKI